jgi:hypothetical protein
MEDGRKRPFQHNGWPASTVDKRHWCDFPTALAAYNKRQDRWSGIGFVFHELDGLVGIDLDNCLHESGVPKDWAQPLLERFADSYSEVSPSGRGVKIWVRGSLPSAVGKVHMDDGGIEMYDRSRYFCVTGQRFRGAPLQVEDHAADVLALHERLSRSHSRAWQYGPAASGRIPKGQRHLTLVSLAGTLRKRGICEEAIRVCLHAVNTHQCEEPEPSANIDRIVASSARWGRG